MFSNSLVNRTFREIKFVPALLQMSKGTAPHETVEDPTFSTVQNSCASRVCIEVPQSMLT
jgi:hypothetical protein